MLITEKCPSTCIFECLSNGAQGNEKCLKCVMYVLPYQKKILEILQKQCINDTAWMREVRHDLLKVVMPHVVTENLQARKGR